MICVSSNHRYFEQRRHTMTTHRSVETDVRQRSEGIGGRNAAFDVDESGDTYDTPMTTRRANWTGRQKNVDVASRKYWHRPNRIWYGVQKGRVGQNAGKWDINTVDFIFQFCLKIMSKIYNKYPVAIKSLQEKENMRISICFCLPGTTVEGNMASNQLHRNFSQKIQISMRQKRLLPTKFLSGSVSFVLTVVLTVT